MIPGNIWLLWVLRIVGWDPQHSGVLGVLRDVSGMVGLDALSCARQGRKEGWGKAGMRLGCWGCRCGCLSDGGHKGIRDAVFHGQGDGLGIGFGDGVSEHRH